jgi:Glucosamine 6-phosphate synthetase, contains amidotransferase and phosphosugar isomerase domains
MCGLFGYVNYGELLKPSQIKKIYCSLAEVCRARGTHASGIAYVAPCSGLAVQKKAKDIVRSGFSYPNEATTLMAHCRLAIWDDYMDNRNNHPYSGRTTDGTEYALAHNGILADLRSIRERTGLPDPEIRIDSYGAVQLLNTKDTLDMQSLKSVCESLEGSYALTILDEFKNLYLCRGDVPLFLVHFRKPKLYVYISTRDLFEKAIAGTALNNDYKINNVETGEDDVGIVPLSKGDIVRISPDGELNRVCFRFNEKKAIHHNWYMHQLTQSPRLKRQLEQLNND